MSKISCDVIRDLLPLYKDHVCSEKSMDLVEEHLPECEDCRKYLEAMDEELPPVSISPKHTGPHSQNSAAFDSAVKDALASDTKIFKKIANQMTLARIIPLCSFVIIIALIVVSVISKNLYWKIPGLDRRVKTEDVRVTELYQLKDGNLYFTLESDTPFQIPSYISYFSPDAKRSNGKSKVAFEKCSSFEENILEKPCFNQCSFAVPLKDIMYMEDPTALDPKYELREIFSICYEGKDGTQLVIWEEGQKVEDAPEKVEERVMQEQDRLENHPDEYFDGYEVLPEYKEGILTIGY